MTHFNRFKKRLERVVRAATRRGVVIKTGDYGRDENFCCPLGALPACRRQGILRPDEGDAASLWGITKHAALQFARGFDCTNPAKERWANPNSPYFKLGQEYAARFP